MNNVMMKQALREAGLVAEEPREGFFGEISAERMAEIAEEIEEQEMLDLWKRINLGNIQGQVRIPLGGTPGGFETAEIFKIEYENLGEVVNVTFVRGKQRLSAQLDPATGQIQQLGRHRLYEQIRSALLSGLLLVTESIPWEILPRGESPWKSRRQQTRTGASTPTVCDETRLRFFESLSPSYRIRGKKDTAFSRYVGYAFMGQKGEGVVFLENPWTKNAIYTFDLVHGLAGIISQTRSQVLNGRTPGFIRRITHRGDWQGEVRALLPA